jgi:hypothetical protein
MKERSYAPINIVKPRKSGAGIFLAAIYILSVCYVSVGSLITCGNIAYCLDIWLSLFVLPWSFLIVAIRDAIGRSETAFWLTFPLFIIGVVLNVLILYKVGKLVEKFVMDGRT